MDDFDIYADLSTFNQEEEENAAELRKKYETLEKELGDLRSKLEKLEGLNGTLKNNFSSLLKTAKAEIARKDRAITDLRSQLDSTLFRRQRQRNNNSTNNNYQPPQAPVNGGYVNPQDQLQLLFQCKFSIPPPLIEPAYSQAKEPCNYYNGNQYDNQHINSAVSHETPSEVEPDAEELVNMEFFCPKEVSDNDSDDGVTNKTQYRSTVYGERLRKKLMEEKENERKKKEEERKILTDKENDKVKVEEEKLKEKERKKEKLDRESKIQREREVEKRKKEDEKFTKEKEREKEKLDRESKFQRERELEKRRKEEKITKEKEREKKKLHRESKIQKEREVDKRRKVEEKLLKEQEREKISKEEEFKILREKEVERKRTAEERLLKDQEKEKIRKEEELKILREKEVERRRKEEEKLLKDQEREKIRKEEELKILREKEVERKKREEEKSLKEKVMESKRKEEEFKISTRRENEKRKKEEEKYLQQKEREMKRKEEELKRLKEKENRSRKTEEEKYLEKIEKEKIEEELKMLNQKANIEAELQQLFEKEKIKDELMMLNTKADIEAKLYKLSRTEKIKVKLMMLNEKADIEDKLFKLSEKERIKKELKMLDIRPRDEDKLHKKRRSKEEFKIQNEKEIEKKSECLDKVNNKENLSLVNETTHGIESVFLCKQSETTKSTSEAVVVKKLDLPSKEDTNKYTNCNGIHRENNNHTKHYNGKNNYHRSLMHKDHRNYNHHYYHDKQKHNGVHYTRIDSRYSRRDQHDNHEKNDRHRSSHRHKSRDNEKSSSKHRYKEDIKSRDHKKSKEKHTRTPKKIEPYKNEEDGKIILENHNIDKKHKEKVKTPKRNRRSNSEEKSPHKCKRRKTNIGDSIAVYTSGTNETLETDIFESEPKQSIKNEKPSENREDSAINNIENINQIINGDKNVEEKKTTPEDKIESLLEELEEGEIIDEEMENNKKTEIKLDVIEKKLKIKEDSKLNDKVIDHEIYNTNPCKTVGEDKKLEKMSINEDEESTNTLELKNEESKRIEKETLISILSQDEPGPHNDARLISEKIEDIVPENSILVRKSLENESNDTIPIITNVNIQKQANSQLDTNDMSGETTCKNMEIETVSTMKNVDTVQNTVNENHHSEKLETKESEEKDNCTATNNSSLKNLFQKKIDIQLNDASLKDKTPFTPVVKAEMSIKNKVVNNGAIRTPIDISKLKMARNIIIVKRRRRPVQLSDSPPVVVSCHDNSNNSRTIIS